MTKRCACLLDRLGRRLHSFCVALFEIVEVAGLWRLDDGEQDALVFLGRELLRCRSRYMTPVSTSTPTRTISVIARKRSVFVKTTLVARPQAVEHAIEEFHEPSAATLAAWLEQNVSTSSATK